MIRNLRFIEDPGHGWLEVDRADLDLLGIASEITKFSYQKDDKVYLEEDQDAGTYILKAHERGWTVNWTRIHQENTFVRDLADYEDIL